MQWRRRAPYQNPFCPIRIIRQLSSMSLRTTPSPKRAGFFDFVAHIIKLLCFLKPTLPGPLKPNTLVILTALPFLILFSERMLLLGYPLGMPSYFEFCMGLGAIGYISYRAYNNHIDPTDINVVLLLLSFSVASVLNQLALGGAALNYIVFWQGAAMVNCILNSLWGSRNQDRDQDSKPKNTP